MLAGLRELEDASMEPGHEDREYWKLDFNVDGVI